MGMGPCLVGLEQKNVSVPTATVLYRTVAVGTETLYVYRSRRLVVLRIIIEVYCTVLYPWVGTVLYAEEYLTFRICDSRLCVKIFHITVTYMQRCGRMR